MKLGDTVYAAVRNDGTIEGTPEGEMISDDKESIKFMLHAWGVPANDVKIVRVKLVEVEAK